MAVAESPINWKIKVSGKKENAKASVIIPVMYHFTKDDAVARAVARARVDHGLTGDLKHEIVESPPEMKPKKIEPNEPEVVVEEGSNV